MAIEYSGMPFQYNPSITNVNIDNQLAGILAQFNEDYIMDLIKDSLGRKVRLYSLPEPNVVTALEANFKSILDGFESYTSEINSVRERVYKEIINIICNYYNFNFHDFEGMDYYSVAWNLYEFFISGFTTNMINFYAIYLLREADSINAALNLTQLRKENDPNYGYSKKLFKDPKLAAIHCNLDKVIYEISNNVVSMDIILGYALSSVNPNIPQYILTYITDRGNFFKDFYEATIMNPVYESDLIISIKLQFQQIAGQYEPIA